MTIAFRCALMAICFVGAAGQEPQSHPSLEPAAVAGFLLQDLDGGVVRFPMGADRVTVIAFVSTRCPMSNAFNSRLNALYIEFSERVRFIVIYSNGNESRDEVRRHAEYMGYDFPVYKDIGNAAADALGAKSTPYTFVVDKRGVIAYRGYIEDAPNPERSKSHALRAAIEAVIQGQPAPVPETYSLGCAIRRSHLESP